MLRVCITVMLCLKVYLLEGALHQTPAHQFAAVGATVETFCSSSECSVDVDLLRWFLKKDSEVIALNTSCKAGPGCRVTTRRASNGDCGLTIRDVKPVDSGVYYCAEYSSYTMAMSSGSLLIITDNSAQNTTVTILAPAVSASALGSKGTLTLVCLVRGLSSPALLVQWFISGNLTETGAPSSWNEGKKGGNGESYSATSRLTIPAETWRSGAVCACGAQLNSSTVIRSREISYTAGASCRVYYAAFSGAALLAVAAAILATCAWIHFCSKEDPTQRADPAVQIKMRCNDDLLTYAHLEFVPQKKGRRKRQA